MKRSLMFLSVLTIVGICSAGVTSNAIVGIDLSPQTASIDSLGHFVGSELLVAIRIEGAKNLDSYQFNVRYNPAKLSLLEASSGISGLPNFLSSKTFELTGFSTPKDSFVNIAYTLNGPQDTAHAPDGNGILAILRFNVVATTACTLVVDSIKLVDNELSRDAIVQTPHAYIVKSTKVDSHTGVSQSQNINVNLIGETRLYSLRGQYMKKENSLIDNGLGVVRKSRAAFNMVVLR